MKKLFMNKSIFLLLPFILFIPLDASSYSQESECFLILHSANLSLTDKQMNQACEEILETGEAFIPDFRDRGLLIKFISLGDTVAIQFY